MTMMAKMIVMSLITIHPANADKSEGGGNEEEKRIRKKINTVVAGFYRYHFARISLACNQIGTIRWMINITKWTAFCDRMFCFALSMSSNVNEIVASTAKFVDFK